MKVDELLRRLKNVDMTVKTQKRRHPIPKVFVLYPDRVKIALTTKYADCWHYVSRSGLTFNGCAEITDSDPYLKIVHGVYYIPTLPIITVSSRQKMSRNEGYFLSYIKDFLLNKYIKDFLLNNKQLTMPQLAVYDNYGFRTYDKFIKGGIRVFPLFDEMDGVKIYKIPDIDPNGFEWNETRQIQEPVPISMVDYYGTHVLGVVKGRVTVYKPILSERGNTVINTLFVNISPDTMISIRRRDGIIIKEIYIEPGWYIFEEVNNESR